MSVKGGKAGAKFSSRAYSLRITQTSEGQCIPLVYGQTRMSPKLVCITQFNATPVDTGKKGGKAGGGSFSYSIAGSWLTGYRPVRSYLTAWEDKDILILNYCDQTFVCPSDGKLSITAIPNPIAVGFPSGSPGELFTIPGTPYQVTVAHAAAFLANTQVIYHDTQLPLMLVTSSPTTGEYTVAAGVYTFSAGDSGRQVEISYTYDGGGGGPPLVYILGATVELPVSETFNDYGSPGPMTWAGNQARPLWDRRYRLPLSDSDTDPAMPSTDPDTRWPYIFGVNNNTLEITIGGPLGPGSLAGRNVTIFYAYQFINQTTGLGTPLANLNMYAEPRLACGNTGGGTTATPAPEYASVPEKWIPYDFVAGIGATMYQLGQSPVLKNLSLELVGLCQYGHARKTSPFFVGGCNPADVLQDMVSSGPLLIEAGTIG